MANMYKEWFNLYKRDYRQDSGRHKGLIYAYCLTSSGVGGRGSDEAARLHWWKIRTSSS